MFANRNAKVIDKIKTIINKRNENDFSERMNDLINNDIEIEMEMEKIIN